MRSANRELGVDLFWLPLGAGGHFVRLNGRVYEALAARVSRRPVQNLYHSALQVRTPEGRFVIEQAPVRASDGHERGVVAQGPVGARWAGRLRIFRYEVRCWRDGLIPDLAEAVESPRRLSDDVEQARQLIAAAPSVPTPVWGRDELHAGEMWNSNSIIAWLITSAGLDAEAIRPPAGGRAPGWHAGHRCRASTTTFGRRCASERGAAGYGRGVTASDANVVVLADGSVAAIRPIAAGDGPVIAATFEALGPESRYRRFLQPMSQLNERTLSFLLDVDPSGRST